MSDQTLWTDVDDYFVSALHATDPSLDSALEASRTAGLPPISVAPNQGKLLHLLARTHGTKNALEIGTLGGYSTIWLARALPDDGRLVTLELDPKHAEVAQANLVNAGVEDMVDVRVGRAVDSLAALESEGRGPFDLIFVDADKPSNPDYFRWALRLSRPGSLIIVDNVVRKGAVVDANGGADAEGVRAMTELIAAEPRVTATAVQTVGSKGYDGFLLALVD